MNLAERLAAVVGDIDEIAVSPVWQEIVPLIDLTLLDPQASAEQIDTLANKAHQNKVAAICVLPEHLSYISPEISICRATVVNFPTGMQPHQEVLQAIEQVATTMQVDEIDYVFPYQMYLSGEKRQALSYYYEAYQLCKQRNLLFKVILETGAFPTSELIYEASVAILNQGCDFLKTSTGKVAIGATLPAAFSILAAIVDSGVQCGLKVSGGIKTKEQALSYMQLAQHVFDRKLDKKCFRVGASSLLDEILNLKLAHN